MVQCFKQMIKVCVRLISTRWYYFLEAPNLCASGRRWNFSASLKTSTLSVDLIMSVCSNKIKQTINGKIESETKRVQPKNDQSLSKKIYPSGWPSVFRIILAYSSLYFKRDSSSIFYRMKKSWCKIFSGVRNYPCRWSALMASNDFMKRVKRNFSFLVNVTDI